MNLEQHLREKLESVLSSITVYRDEITIETTPICVHALLKELKHDSAFQFDVLIDLCGVDYLEYGVDEWNTETVTSTGFSRGVDNLLNKEEQLERFRNGPRFAVVYHLLSTVLNHRLRVRVFLEEDALLIDTASNIWSAANWFEREAYDLYGILFNGHNDLRRILTDYGFIGHPFRKDFPVSGHVEVRYDAKLGRVVNGPVEIQPRTLVPKVIRKIPTQEVQKSHGN